MVPVRNPIKSPLFLSKMSGSAQAIFSLLQEKETKLYQIPKGREIKYKIVYNKTVSYFLGTLGEPLVDSPGWGSL